MGYSLKADGMGVNQIPCPSYTETLTKHVFVCGYLFQATWHLDAADLQGMETGHVILSKELCLWGHIFKLQFYPRGASKATSGNCSLLLSSNVPHKVHLRIKGAQVSRNLTGGAVSGSLYFGKQPDLSRPVEIEACFTEMSGKDAFALRKEAICYYEKTALDLQSKVRALEGQAAERSRNSYHAATRIQSAWRMFACRTLMRSRLAERRRSVKHARELMAAQRVQLA